MSFAAVEQALSVSVCMITYNQAQYVAQAIEGVLSQRTAFPVRLLIADDCSTDATRQIIADYAARFPAQITCLERTQNMGMMPNFIDALHHCTGRYVAICEGDDYWIDPLKLQKQVDFLETHPDYAICFTRVFEEMSGQRSVSPLNPWDEERTFSIQELAQGNLMHTPSVMYRNGLLTEFPAWFPQSPIGDYVLHLLHARHGLVKYLPDITAVYRRFVGLWSTQPMRQQYRKFSRALDFLLTEDFDPLVKAKLLDQKRFCISESCKLALQDNDFAYLAEMEAYLAEADVHAAFVTDWMLTIYPQKIQSILHSWPYRLYQQEQAAIKAVRRVLGRGKRTLKRILPG